MVQQIKTENSSASFFEPKLSVSSTPSIQDLREQTRKEIAVIKHYAGNISSPKAEFIIYQIPGFPEALNKIVESVRGSVESKTITEIEGRELIKKAITNVSYTDIFNPKYAIQKMYEVLDGQRNQDLKKDQHLDPHKITPAGTGSSSSLEKSSSNLSTAELANRFGKIRDYFNYHGLNFLDNLPQKFENISLQDQNSVVSNLQKVLSTLNEVRPDLHGQKRTQAQMSAVIDALRDTNNSVDKNGYALKWRNNVTDKEWTDIFAKNMGANVTKAPIPDEATTQYLQELGRQAVIKNTHLIEVQTPTIYIVPNQRSNSYDSERALLKNGSEYRQIIKDLKAINTQLSINPDAIDSYKETLVNKLKQLSEVPGIVFPGHLQGMALGLANQIENSSSFDIVQKAQLAGIINGFKDVYDADVDRLFFEKSFARKTANNLRNRIIKTIADPSRLDGESGSIGEIRRNNMLQDIRELVKFTDGTSWNATSLIALQGNLKDSVALQNALKALENSSNSR